MTEIMDAELSLVNAEVNYKMYFCVVSNKLLIQLQEDNSDFIWKNSFTLAELRHFDTFEQVVDQVVSYPGDVKITFEKGSD